jgi:tetratricopeptide (TPR) repeat protein
MAKHVLIRGAMIAAIAGLTLAGCAPAGPMVSVLRGNLAYARGEYQAALVHYLAAEDSKSDAWVLFNTANVYYALGEQDAALETWDRARNAGEGSEDGPAVELVHSASFNRGVLLFERGQYDAAYDEFRYALSLAPTSLATKRNLEIALERGRAADPEGPGAGTGNGEAADANDTSTLRILEYVRRKEADQWFANREEIEAGSVRDW